MLIRFDVTPALVHVQIDVDVAVVLQREEMMSRVDDAGASRRLDVRRRYRTRLALGNTQDGLFDIVRERERQILEIADDLVNVLDDARNGLVLVDDAIDAKAPDGGAAQR